MAGFLRLFSIVALLSGGIMTSAVAQQVAPPPHLVPELDPIEAAAARIAADISAGLANAPRTYFQPAPAVPAPEADSAPSEPPSLWGFIKKKLKDRQAPVPTASPAVAEAAPDPDAFVRKIAFWPVWEDELEVSESFVRTVNDAVLAELIRARHPDDRYLARDHLWRLSEELDRGASPQESAAGISALMRRAGADVLIMAQLQPVNGASLRISYKAVSVNSSGVLAQSRWQKLDYDFDRARTLSLQAALGTAAKDMVAGARGLKDVTLLGLTYQDTGVQTPFASWVLKGLTAEIENAASAQPISINLARLETDLSGQSLQKTSAEARIAGAVEGRYLLSGQYWDLGDTVDFQFQLEAGDGTAARWSGQVRKSSIPETFELTPRRPDRRQTPLAEQVGPIQLTLSSMAGRNPVLRIGDELTLLFEVSAPSYLYCFYLQEDGKLFRIFPNKLHTDARLDGGRAISLPGPEEAFVWKVEPPAGPELLSCYATDRDVLHQLPVDVATQDFVPLSYAGMGDVDGMFAALENVAYARNSMVVNVVPK